MLIYHPGNVTLMQVYMLTADILQSGLYGTHILAIQGSTGPSHIDAETCLYRVTQLIQQQLSLHGRPI